MNGPITDLLNEPEVEFEDHGLVLIWWDDDGRGIASLTVRDGQIVAFKTRLGEKGRAWKIPLRPGLVRIGREEAPAAVAVSDVLDPATFPNPTDPDDPVNDGGWREIFGELHNLFEEMREAGLPRERAVEVMMQSSLRLRRRRRG